MGLCYGKNIAAADDVSGDRPSSTSVNGVAARDSTPAHASSPNPWPSPYPVSASPFPSSGGASASPLPGGVTPSPARTSTPRRFFRRPFPPPSPAKHIKASLMKRQGQAKPKEGPIPEDGVEAERPLDKSFGYSKNFAAKYEVGKEVGRGHFGHTCSARARKGEIKGQLVAVKIISKAKV